MNKLRRRRGDNNISIASVWSVMTPAGVLANANGVSEETAWRVFIHYSGESDLYRGVIKVASRTYDSPILPRRTHT
jgi:hypothetical protein